MKKLLLAILLSAPAWCATVTTITQPMASPGENALNPSGVPASGWAQISLSSPCLSGSEFVDTAPVIVSFSSVFSVQLVPNDTCTPFGSSAQTTYTAIFHFDGQPKPVVQTWCVYTSTTPLSIAAVTACANTNAALSWSHLTPSAWASITAAQLAAIVP